MKTNCESGGTPREEYQVRLEKFTALLESLKQRDKRLSNARLMLFLLFLGSAGWVFSSQAILSLSSLLPLACLALFIGFVEVHRRCRRDMARAERAAAFYEKGIARLEDRWMGQGESGAQYKAPGHLYAEDLDLFGKGSLFELLCTARTQPGRDALASWLQAPAATEAVLKRQACVKELTDALDLREAVACLDHEASDAADTTKFIAWSREKAVFSSGRPRYIAFMLTGLLLGSVVASLYSRFFFLGAFVLMFLEWLFLMYHTGRIKAVAESAKGMARSLGLFQQALKMLEDTEFHAPKLQALKVRLSSGSQCASREIGRIQILIDRYVLVFTNMVMGFLGLVLVLPLHTAYAMEKWRKNVGPHIKDWMHSLGEFEALLSMSCFAYEHPGYAYPERLADGQGIEGINMGHPLIPRETCVLNDVKLDRDRQLLIVSGSNMSGKSTLLRVVGINTVLFYMGAPVHADRFRVSDLVIGCSIHILDSLQEGASHFYAEMARLRDITLLLNGGTPVLFLLDELMHGTNSHDRRIGSEAILKKLLDSGAIGLITTHDLALGKMVEKFGGKAENTHFEYQLRDGKMFFDYKMRPGVVKESNALAVMRSLGLEV